jgi:alkanesulfonate monooxygenase SsuD/methylene tetrahydromethanopterin reductase-like flavin-dependent oxidoreductase (luciferase family)
MAAALVGLASLALVAFWFGPVGALIAALAGSMVLYGVGDDGRRLATGATVLTAQARRVRIGPAVTYAVYPSSHHPSWLAERATTVDHLSNGRLDLRLGIGAEDNATREVWQSHGIRYPPRAERAARVAEAVDMIRVLWQGGPVDRLGGFGDLSSVLGGPPPGGAESGAASVDRGYECTCPGDGGPTGRWLGGAPSRTSTRSVKVPPTSALTR